MTSPDILNALKPLLATPTPPGLGPGPRSQVWPLDTLRLRLDEVLRRTSLPAGRQELLRALIYLWHDHHDASHTLSQGIENADGSYVHGILHRREPDYGNAKYWFRRVGRHAAYVELAARAGTLLRDGGHTELANQLLPRGEWPEVRSRPCQEARVRNRRPAATVSDDCEIWGLRRLPAGGLVAPCLPLSRIRVVDDRTDLVEDHRRPAVRVVRRPGRLSRRCRPPRSSPCLTPWMRRAAR